ncbi:MAG TPA: DUF4390 domain-containing protein [Longimicrobiales bacterium]
MITLLFALALGLAATPAAARQGPALTVAADPAAGYRPVLRLGTVLDDPALEETVRSGLPLRLRFRIELWRDGFFDDLVATEAWTAVLAYEPLEQRFFVRTRSSPEAVRWFSSFAAARTAVEGTYTPAIRPRRPGRYYYIATLEIETLSLSDLEELQQWLRGELRPVVRGEGSLPGAVGEGAKRLLVRMLGLPTRRHEARTGKFRFPG